MPFGAGIGVRNLAETNMACAAPEGSFKTVLAFNLTVLHYSMDLETQVGHWKQKLVSSLEVEERGGQVVKWPITYIIHRKTVILLFGSLAAANLHIVFWSE
ncbi:hypothetical protein M405DRAFT_894952 [Rhizopogon salebrosus TDB-379]|nr:hypothetical protein M405DRAFT_894952 [Rhizopogon salebrosus TDB-379]